MSRTVIVVVALVAAGLAWGALRPDEQQRVQRDITRLNSELPMSSGGQVKMTRIALENKTVKSWYRIAATFETDPETTAAVRKALVVQACADTTFREMMTKGYAFDNIVDVDTPHGPGQFKILIGAGDCA